VATEENRPAQGKTILQLAKEAGREPYDFAVELMLKEEGRIGMVGFGMDEPGTERILAWRNTMIASDGGAYYPGSDTSPHPRTYGTFPRALAFYCRERKIMTLPEMVRRMTSLPAAKLGLADRGVLSAGKAADCVLFDPLSVRDRATYADPHQFPEGIPHVIINGVQVVENGRPTGERPGMVIRSV
jgi:N-acyl-D-aspartate/D-glutamate deacylase